MNLKTEYRNSKLPGFLTDIAKVMVRLSASAR